MEEPAVLLTREGHIATITLNRPGKLNALSADLVDGLHRALDEIAAGDARVIIITGSGRGFCSGADVSDLRKRAEGASDGPNTGVRDWLTNRSIIDFAPRFMAVPQVVIAAVNGVAAGAGLALALGADLRVASDQARFASLFIRRSLTPDAGVSYLLPRTVGPTIAAEMALTGAMYDAAWCKSVGLVNRVVPHDSLMPETLDLAEVVAANPPVALTATKRLLWRGLHTDLRQAIENESYYNVWLRRTGDSVEAIAAFQEKRTPVFTGR